MPNRKHSDLVKHDLVYRAAVVNVLSLRQTQWNDALAGLHAEADSIARAADLIIGSLRAGHKVLTAGNGGSAAQAQHFAAELVGRFKLERGAYAALSLTTDTSVLTAVGNDYGYQDIFARQIFGLGMSGDVLLLLSTSGESENLVRAAVAARQCRIPIITVSGRTGCRLDRLADVTICSPAEESALVQEIHLLVVHLLCDIVEGELAIGESMQ